MTVGRPFSSCTYYFRKEEAEVSSVRPTVSGCLEPSSSQSHGVSHRLSSLRLAQPGVDLVVQCDAVLRNRDRMFRIDAFKVRFSPVSEHRTQMVKVKQPSLSKTGGDDVALESGREDKGNTEDAAEDFDPDIQHILPSQASSSKM